VKILKSKTLKPGSSTSQCDLEPPFYLLNLHCLQNEDNNRALPLLYDAVKTK